MSAMTILNTDNLYTVFDTLGIQKIILFLPTRNLELFDNWR